MMDYGSVTYLTVKSFHIIFMVSYFAGLFYAIRLMVYYREAMETEHVEVLQNQYKLMLKKLWNVIIVPAGIIMLLSGIFMLMASQAFLLQQPWMHIKLTILLLFLGFHLFSWKQVQSIVRNNKAKFTSVQYRKINEIPTLFLLSIVFVVILKRQFIPYFPKLLLGFIVIAILIFVTVKLVNRKN